MTQPQRSSAEVAWQGATASVALNLVGMPLDLLMGHSVQGAPAWAPLASMGVAGILLVYLHAFRREPRVHRASLVFLVNNAVIAAALWVTSTHYAAALAPWAPFQANKLAVLTVALLAPAEVYVGVTTILIFALSALVRLWTFAPDIRSKLPMGESIVMIAFSVFALCLLAYRLRRHALELALVRSHAEAAALEATARRLLAIRDMANTPLQTLEINAALLADVQEARPYADRIRRSLVKLHEWHRMLDEESSRAQWTVEQEAFDPKEVMDRARDRVPPRVRSPAQR